MSNDHVNLYWALVRIGDLVERVAIALEEYNVGMKYGWNVNPLHGPATADDE